MCFVCVCVYETKLTMFIQYLKQNSGLQYNLSIHLSSKKRKKVELQLLQNGTKKKLVFGPLFYGPCSVPVHTGLYHVGKY